MSCATFMPLILPLCATFAVSPPLLSYSCSTMSGRRLLSLHSRRLITWKSILRRGAVLHTLHVLPTMAFFFLFLFMPLFAAFLLTVYVALCKPGCAISAADTSSV